jgi:hypothetical protein
MFTSIQGGIMKTIVAILLVLIAATPLFAEELCQFKDIPFGSNKSTVLDKLDYKNKGSWQSGNSYFLHSYKLGDRTVTLGADFDDNDQFYRFVFNFKSYAPDEDGSKLIKDDYSYIATIFADKYGNPAKINPIDKLKLIVINKPEPLQEWKNGTCQAYVGIGKDFQKFNATAAVFDTALLDAQIARRENKKMDGLTRAKKDF